MLSFDTFVKSKKVLSLLRISRPSLYRYKEQGILDASKLPNGQYNYDEKTVFSFLNKDIPRKIYLLDCEEITHHETYAGKRISRGLFKSSKGILINADVNGA